MSDIPVIKTCPLGHTCRKVVGDHIEECHWYVTVQSVDNEGAPAEQSKCAMAWQPIIAIENNKETRGVSASVQSFRNESIKRQDATLALEVTRDEKIIASS